MSCYAWLDIQLVLNVARRKLFMLDNAAELDDLKSPPGNKFHPLKDDREGQHAIRINDQYRLCFRWVDGNAEDVEIADYQRKDLTMRNFNVVAIHPGEILREEYMVPLCLKAYTLAKKLGVPRTRIERLAAQQSPVTPDTALRLAKFFGTTPQFWMNMQSSCDLATEAKAKTKELAAIESYAESRLAA